MTERLRECPFCGGEAELIKSLHPWVQCKSKDCFFHKALSTASPFPWDEEMTIKYWNRRAYDREG